MLYGDLNEKDFQKRGDMCIHILDSPCCTAETNTTLLINCTTIKKQTNKKTPELGTGTAVLIMGNVFFQ